MSREKGSTKIFNTHRAEVFGHSNKMKDELTNLKKKENREKLEKFMLEEQQIKQLERLFADEEFMKKYGVMRYNGQEMRIDEAISRYGDDFINSSAHAYQDWRAGMVDIINACLRLLKLVNYTQGPILISLARSLEDNLYQPAAVIIRQKIADKAEFELPDLYYAVQMEKNGKLDIMDLEIAPAINLKDGNILERGNISLNRLFQKGIEHWLWEHNLKKNESGKIVSKDRPNEPLTKKEFDNIKDDPGRGLKSWLDGNYELNFHHKTATNAF